jgi:hypothetical protein
MKKILTILLLVISCQAFAQQQDSLKAYNAERISITSHGMAVLGSWGIVNLGAGALWGWNGGSSHINPNTGSTTAPISYSNSTEKKYFFQMGAIWGSVDFVTALLGYTSTQKYKNKKNLTAAQVLEQQNRIEKIFRINSYLDIGYIGAGLYLKLAGDSRNSPIMKGYGESILVQGGFLLLFDELMLKAEKGNGSKLRNFLEKHPVSFNGQRLGIVFNM